MNTGEGVLTEVTAAFCLAGKGITHKGDGWQITTDDKEVWLQEYRGDRLALQERLSWYHFLRGNGIVAIPQLLSTQVKELVVEVGGTLFFGWHQPAGETFSGHNEQQLVDAISSLASIHAYSSRYEVERVVDYQTEWRLPMQIQDRLTDLLFFSHKIAEKRLCDDFQKVYQENFDFIYDQGQEAIQKMVLVNCLDSCKSKYSILVNNFLPEGIIYKEGQVVFLPNAIWTKGPTVQDLAGFLRNYLGLHNWDSQLAYKLIRQYEEHNPLKMAEKHMLLALMRYPARFWLYACQYQKRERSTSELTAKLIDLVHEIRLRDNCLDKLDTLLSGGE